MKKLSHILCFCLSGVSCSPNAPPHYDPPKAQCSGTQICAYDVHDTFLGIVQNKDESGKMEIITSKGYHLFLDEKAEEVDANYSKIKLLAISSPLKADNMAIFLSDDVQKSPQITFSFTTDIASGFPNPIRVCYSGTPLELNKGLGYNEMSRIEEDKEYPGVFQYKWNKALVSSGKYLPLKICDQKSVGIPNYIERKSNSETYISMKNAKGDEYTGTVVNSKCSKGTQNCLL